MAALHAPATCTTATDLDREGAHDRADDREIFLVLPRGAGAAQAASTVRTGRGQSRPMALVDVRRDRAMGFLAICAARSPTWSSRRPCRGTPRERGGLPIHLAAGVVELVFESVDLLAKCVPLLSVPVSIPIRPLVLAPQSLDLTLLSLQLRDQVVPRRRAPSGVHASVMPWSSMKYKQERLRAARRRPPVRLVTR